MNRLAPWPAPMAGARARLARHLEGRGVELGPGHQPYQVPSEGIEVRYVDRWEPDQNRELFPELVEIGQGGGFPKPHVVANFDVDRLAPLDDASQDFVICSHVLEHLAEPIGFIDEIHRVLRPGGLALILLPDRRATFDAGRASTPLAHLVAEHQQGITDVDDDHVLDFLANAGEGAAYLEIPEDPGERAKAFDWHRQRSIHVHCWTEEEFPDVLGYGIATLGWAWTLVDGLGVADEGPEGIEFGYVLRRSTVALDRAERAARFRRDWTAWFADRQELYAELDGVEATTTELATARTELATAHAELGRVRSELEAVRNDPTVRRVKKAREVAGGARAKVRSATKRVTG